MTDTTCILAEEPTEEQTEKQTEKQTVDTEFEGDEALITSRTYWADLLPALQRLDHLLERAVTVAETAYGPEAANDLYRGLYVNRTEVERLLRRDPLVSPFPLNGSEPKENKSETEIEFSRLAWLELTFGLSSVDMDVLILALAPELDRRYERIYAYLQDHVSRKRPTVDLALNLLCADAGERLERRVHFHPNAPLIRHALLHLIPEANEAQPSLLSHSLKLDPQIIDFLLHQDGLDARLAPFCQYAFSLLLSDDLTLRSEAQQALPALVNQAQADEQPLRLYFYGAEGTGKRHFAASLAAEVDAYLLVIDLPGALAAELDFDQVLRLILRTAWFQGVIPYFEGLDHLRSETHAKAYQQLLAALADHSGITILAGSQPWTPTGRTPLGIISVPFTLPGYSERRQLWQTHLALADIELAEADLDALAGRFRLTPTQIAEATASAANQVYMQSMMVAENGSSIHNSPFTIYHSLFSAARAQSGHDLDTLARKIDPLYTWDDIVLPDDTLAQLHEICQRVAHGHKVLGEWGFERKLSLGKGVTVLFAGPSGTGKTMAAEIIANALGLDLYKIDLSGVVSKYIGETEKNLNRIFSAAENANAILFFDEADALFGKRSEVHDSHDRYANIEISYLLQKMEEYDGLAILATNLRQNLDEAFLRRLAFTVHFPFPDETSRRQIWSSIWPAATPMALSDPADSSPEPVASPELVEGGACQQAVDIEFLARQFKLSGGNIKNIALAAAFLAAEDGGAVSMVHVTHAVRREYQKLGKALSAEELDGWRRQQRIERGRD